MFEAYQQSRRCFCCRRALNCLEALARGAEDRATLNVFPRWHDHGLESAQGGFGNRGQQRKSSYCIAHNSVPTSCLTV